MAAFSGTMREVTPEELEDYKEAFDNFDKVGAGKYCIASTTCYDRYHATSRHLRTLTRWATLTHSMLQTTIQTFACVTMNTTSGRSTVLTRKENYTAGSCPPPMC